MIIGGGMAFTFKHFVDGVKVHLLLLHQQQILTYGRLETHSLRNPPMN